MMISPRVKEYLTVGKTLDDLRQQEPEMRAAGFRKRYGAHGQAQTLTREYYQWWDRASVKSSWTTVQQERRQQGLCIKCGEPAAQKCNGNNSQFCLKHLVAHREWQRERLGFKRRYWQASSYR